MKTNDIKITQRAEYYYTAIDLFQSVHQNRSMWRAYMCVRLETQSTEAIFKG